MKEINYVKEDKGITNMTLIVLVLVIFIILLLAFSAYLIINPKTVYITQNTPAQQQVDSLKVENIDIEDKEIESKKEMTADEKYSIWVQNVEKEVNKYNANALYQDIELSNGNFINVGLTSKGILYLTREEQGSREFDTDVISFEICDVGNGGYKAAYYIKKDGTVSFVVLDEYDKNDGEVKSILVKDAKNIVSIVNNTDEQSYASEIWLIDIDGKVYHNN